jgi:hypothetical protein
VNHGARAGTVPADERSVSEMPNYLLSMHYGDWTPPADELDVIMKDVAAFNEELQAAGRWGFTAGLEPPSTATVVRVEGGQVLTTDGPYLESNAYVRR